MKPSARPQSKIPTTGKNTNQKKKTTSSDSMDMDASLLKKNEFTLIIVGALVVTVLVFFLFFRDSGTDAGKALMSGNKMTGEHVDEAMGKRVAELEVALARLASSPNAEDAAASKDQVSLKNLAELEQRLGRFETAMTLKVDSLIDRLNKLDRKVSALKNSPAKHGPVVKASKTASKSPAKAPVTKKPVQPVKKKAAMFHTVKKGETLWSISQKYKTTVSAIRKLNNLSPKDNIYPGSNILVR